MAVDALYLNGKAYMPLLMPPQIDKVCLRVMLTGATGRRSVPQPAPMTYPLDFMSMSFGPYPPSEEPMARSRRSPDHS